jgi:hypothetical protein
LIVRPSERSKTAAAYWWRPSGLEKCATFDGHLYCIEEAAANTVDARSERCATHDGVLYCIAEDT